jgi:hypothetical protein
MAKDKNLIRELKGLGGELSKAVVQIRRSKEFKHLEKEVAQSVKTISSSLMDGLKAAKKSDQAARIKEKMNRVISAGAVEGKAGAKKAQAAAASHLRKVRIAIREMRSRLKKGS